MRAAECWWSSSTRLAQVARYDGDRRMRDIEACLRAAGPKLYHPDLRGKVSRSTLAEANEAHDRRIFADFAQILIAIARTLYAEDPMRIEISFGGHCL
jgi:hypothetical protein